MMSIIEKEGDIFTTDSKVIGHGCNCFGVWGGGISLAFLKRYPAMHEAYKAHCNANGDEFRPKPGEVMWYRNADFMVGNMFTQYKPGPDARYSWIVNATKTALDKCAEHNEPTFAIPRLGAGIGGLDWNQTLYNLTDAFHDHKVDLEIWTLPNV